MTHRPSDADREPEAARHQAHAAGATMRSLPRRFLRWLKADLPQGFPGFEDESPDGLDDGDDAENRGILGGPAARDAPPFDEVHAASAAPARPVARPPVASPPASSYGARRARARPRHRAHRARGGFWTASAATLGLLALAAVGFVALNAARGTAPPAAGARGATSARSSQTAGAAPSSTTAAARGQRPTPAAALGQPNCAAMHHMLAVPPSGSQPVPGLCYTLGNGRSWLVGCAPGFQASCDPALQRVLVCLRQTGARHGGVVTKADVWACAGVSDAGPAASGTPAMG